MPIHVLSSLQDIVRDRDTVYCAFIRASPFSRAQVSKYFLSCRVRVQHFVQIYFHFQSVTKKSRALLPKFLSFYTSLTFIIVFNFLKNFHSFVATDNFLFAKWWLNKWYFAKSWNLNRCKFSCWIFFCLLLYHRLGWKFSRYVTEIY